MDKPMNLTNIMKSGFIKTDVEEFKKKLGNACFDFLEEEQIVLLLITKILLRGINVKSVISFSYICIDYSFILVSASKAFEGHLKKIAKKVGLTEKETDDIGRVFEGKNAYDKLRDKDEYRGVPKRILGDWNSCRNDLLHYKKRFFVKTIDNAKEIFEQILKTIKISFEAYIEDSFYVPPPIKKSLVAKEEPSQEITIEALRSEALRRLRRV